MASNPNRDWLSENSPSKSPRSPRSPSGCCELHSAAPRARRRRQRSARCGRPVSSRARRRRRRSARCSSCPRRRAVRSSTPGCARGASCWRTRFARGVRSRRYICAAQSCLCARPLPPPSPPGAVECARWHEYTVMLPLDPHPGARRRAARHGRDRLHPRRRPAPVAVVRGAVRAAQRTRDYTPRG